MCIRDRASTGTFSRAPSSPSDPSVTTTGMASPAASTPRAALPRDERREVSIPADSSVANRENRKQVAAATGAATTDTIAGPQPAALHTITGASARAAVNLSLIHISEPTRLGMISYAVFCLKKKKQ